MASTTVTTTSLGTSNMRGSSRQTRNNPTRTSRKYRASLQQNSLVSDPPALTPGVSEPYGFYPAISHFTDAIAALPRDYRRHVSLLKEADAKAWVPEDNLQKLFVQCLAERQTRPSTSAAQTMADSRSTVAEDLSGLSAAGSVSGGAPFDNVSQSSLPSVDPMGVQRRQLYHSLRLNLMEMMVTMDEKNHVITNANEDLSRHIRRLDDTWQHVSGEISDEARLGSLKHWAYTDLNPPKKAVAVAVPSRREAAAGLAILADNDIAHRSESRREAMLAKKQRLNQPVDSDFDEKGAGRKGVPGKSKKPETGGAEALPPVVAAGAGKRKRPDKTVGGVGMERTTSGLRASAAAAAATAAAAAAAAAVSREPYQQDSSTKKRKAPTGAGTVARKRFNVQQQESPKLASSPLANAAGKEVVKRSPALTSVRPVGRGRQNSGHGTEGSRNKASSTLQYLKNLMDGPRIDSAEVKNVASATGRSTSEIKNTMKESTNSKGDKLVEAVPGTNGDSIMRGGILLERSLSSRGAKKELMTDDIRSMPSPRSMPAMLNHEVKASSTKSRASKTSTSTPVVGSFADADGDDSGGANGSENSTTVGGSNKPKRVSRPRIKDHHGLHDSLSPRGLPVKRAHGRNASLGSLNTAPPGHGRPSTSRARGSERDEEMSARSTIRNHSSAALQGAVGPAKSTDNDGEAEVEETALSDEDELRYCYCNGVSYGEMVACDNKNCPREWFHLECIGLKSVPKSAKWYCDECKENLARKGRFGSHGNGSGSGSGNGSGNGSGGGSGSGSGSGNGSVHSHGHG